QSFRIFDSGDTGCDAADGRLRPAVHVPAGDRVEPGCRWRSGVSASATASCVAVVFYPEHDGPTGHAGHGVHAALSAAVSEEELRCVRGRLYRARAGKGNG